MPPWSPSRNSPFSAGGGRVGPDSTKPGEGWSRRRRRACWTCGPEGSLTRVRGTGPNRAPHTGQWLCVATCPVATRTCRRGDSDSHTGRLMLDPGQCGCCPDKSIASPDKGRSHGMPRPRHVRDGREGWQSTDCLRHSPMPIDIQVGEDACHGLPVPQVGGDACVCGTGRPWPGVDLALDDEAVELRQQPRPPLCSPPPPHLDRAVVGQGSLPSRPAKARHAPHTRSRRRKRAADAAPTCVARERLTRPAGRMSARRRGRSEAAADARVDIKETGFGGGRRACRIRTSRRAPMPAAQQVLNLNQFFSSLILDSEL